MKRVAVFLTVTIMLLTIIGCARSNPKFKLAQKVTVNGCSGVIVKAKHHMSGWSYVVGFSLECPTCKDQPQWIPSEFQKEFAESSISPAAESHEDSSGMEMP